MTQSNNEEAKTTQKR